MRCPVTKYNKGDPEFFRRIPEDNNFGLFLKDGALDRLESNTSDLLPRVREYLKQLHRSTGRAVHADDARAWLDLARIPDYQRGEKMEWMGAIFRGEEWRAVGWTTSQHPENHGRAIREWRLR